MTENEAEARVERLLRGALASVRREATAVPAAVTRRAVVRGARSRRVRRAAAGLVPVLAAVVVVVVVLSVQTGTPAPVSGGPTGTVGVDGWQRAARSPLSPRQGATMVKAGREILVFGGTDGPPCPPTAFCIPGPEHDLRDGAGYDPVRDTWRRLADAPLRMNNVSATLIGDVVYVLIRPSSASRSPRLLGYSISGDRWTLLPDPPAGVESLVAVGGDRLVGAHTSEGPATAPDRIYHVATRSWTAMARDPLAPSRDRNLLATDSGDLVLVAVDRAGPPGARKFWRAASWSAKSGAWTKLPSSRIVDSDPTWFWTAGRAVNPSTQIVAPTGAPAGGTLDPATSAWGPVPTQPDTIGGPSPVAAGEGRVLHDRQLLDVAAGVRRPLPAVPAEFSYDGTSAVLGQGRLVVFGGARFEGLKGTLTNDTWVLRLP